MNVKYVVVSVVALGAMLGSLVGIRSATGGTPGIAHADAPAPFVGGTVTQVYPLSIAVAGSGFTPGGRVHVALYVAYWQPTYGGGTGSGTVGTATVTPTVTATPTARVLGAATIVDSTDTTAARTTNVPNGHGIVFRRVGGYFNTILASSSLYCLDYNYWLVATDETTGVTVAGVPTEEDAVCS